MPSRPFSFTLNNRATPYDAARARRSEKLTMPFYEYECSACKHHIEVLQKISDAPLKKCPECGKQTLKRLISAPVFRLKGGGWYETDFKSDKETKRNLAAVRRSESKAEEAKIGLATAETSQGRPRQRRRSQSQPTAKAEAARNLSEASKSSRKSAAARSAAKKSTPATKV